MNNSSDIHSSRSAIWMRRSKQQNTSGTQLSLSHNCSSSSSSSSSSLYSSPPNTTTTSDEDEDEEEILSVTSCGQLEHQEDMDDDRRQDQDANVRILIQEQPPLSPPPFILDPSHFTYRPIQVSDRNQIQQLHEEWFPVTYQSEFYDDLSQGHLAGNPLFTSLAIYKKKKNRQNPHHHYCQQINHQQQSSYRSDSQTPKQVRQQPSWQWPTMSDSIERRSLLPGTTTNPTSSLMLDEEMGVMVDNPMMTTTDGKNDNIALQLSSDDHVPRQLLDLNNNNNNGEEEELKPFTSETTSNGVTSYVDFVDTDNNDHEDDTEEVIAGCVVGSFMPVTRLPTVVQNMLISNPLRHPKLFYIMTVGTATEFRMAGLGTKLVQQCIDQVATDPSCGALYLHVITHNQGAIRLYEKLGFYRVQEIPDYYDIHGGKYPCYLYAKYFHGNRGHRALYQVLAHCIWSFVRQFFQLAHLFPPAFLLPPPNTTRRRRSSSSSNDYDYVDATGDPKL